MRQLAYFVFGLAVADDAFKHQTVDGGVNVLLGLDGREEGVEQAAAVDEAVVRLFLVDAGNEVGRAVGLAELYVVPHAFHAYG